MIELVISDVGFIMIIMSVSEINLEIQLKIKFILLTTIKRYYIPGIS